MKPLNLAIYCLETYIVKMKLNGFRFSAEYTEKALKAFLKNHGNIEIISIVAKENYYETTLIAKTLREISESLRG